MDRKKQDEYHFVKEHIKKMPLNKKKQAARIAWAVLLAAIFGVVFSLVFTFTRPVFEQWIAEDEEQVNLSAEEPEEDTQDTDTEPEQVYITETQQMELSDYQILQNKLYAVGRSANKSVVSVTGITNAQDWFDSDYETKGQGAGIIIADTNQNFLVVTEKKLIADASQIEVTFYDNTDAAADLVAYDGNTGIAVLSVAKDLMTETTLENVVVAELGNSASVSQGTIVIAIGSPLGEAFSVVPGNVTGTGYEVTTADGNYKVISTDITSSQEGSGALINLDGKVIGLIMQSYNKQDQQNTVTAIGISEIKSLMEKLSNGVTPSYLGLEISTVTEEISTEYNLPEGVYIKNVQVDSPAMVAGLQIGDVIVKIGGTDVLTEEQYEEYIEETKTGQTIRVTVLRMGADGNYQEVVCEATLDVLQ